LGECGKLSPILTTQRDAISISRPHWNAIDNAGGMASSPEYFIDGKNPIFYDLMGSASPAGAKFFALPKKR